MISIREYQRKQALPFSKAKISSALVIAISYKEQIVDDLQTLAARGIRTDIVKDQPSEPLENIKDNYDLIIYAFHNSPHCPAGVSGPSGEQAIAVWLFLYAGVDMSVVISLGSPYVIDNYFEMADLCINAYSPSPVKLN
jgi:beta-N-acetylhexosaminidase